MSSIKDHRPVPKVCKVCGKEFQARWLRREAAKFCSLKCRGIAQTKGIWKERRKGNIIKVICHYCRKEFTIKNRRKLKPSHHKYCNKKCHTEAQRTGIAFRNKKNETKIRNRKKTESCIICGFNRFIEICHIVPPNMGGTYDENNILYCCPNHHRLLDHGLLTKMEQEKIGDRIHLVYSPYTKKKLYP